MRFLNKKAVILAVAVLTVFLLALSAARGKYNFYWSERIVTVVLAPVEYVVSKVGYSVRHAGASAGDLFSVYRDNRALREEVENLRQELVANTEIAAENARLKVLLDYRKAAPQFDTVVAAVVARDPAAWTNVIIINRGTAQGVAKDMAVVTPQGLVGSVVQAYNNSAKVQLILDPRSAVGALVQRPESRVAAIVEGNPAKPLAPKMINLARDADIIKGDKVITSGFGGIYPKGILVGEVTDVVNEEGGLLKYAVLKPAADFDRLEEVAVIVRSREPVTAAPGSVPVRPAPKGAGQ
ncbi:rod shape-determining protein MreC [Anaeroselena agilis]|uniref:Cell shape-determining protein MreC n=1 Tax=Anaeroselena agilis TaxID=3063788 RepID=A0ABU3NZP1_9FIRM|nr:rod shape-determining protein MreC [Selenomonadales bacterium 4137-cl]